MAPFGLTSTAIRGASFILHPALAWTVTPNKTQVAVPKNHDEETYFAPKGSLDRLLRDSRFLSLLKTLKKVPRIMSWIEEACSSGCQICLKDYPEQRRMAISLCGHTMCDACLQLIMGDKMKSVYCPSCRREIFVVLILDRPKKFCSLDNVRHFLLQDDTPVHDPSLMLGPLVSLWRLGKEYPIPMKPSSVEPIPALYSRMRDSEVRGPVKSPLKSVGKEIDHEEESYNRKSQAVIQSVLTSLGTDEEPFLTTTINDEDIIDWNRVFNDEDDKPNTNAQLAWPRPYHPTLVYDVDVRMDCNFLNFETTDAGNPCHNASAVKRTTQSCCCEIDSGFNRLCDCGMDEHCRECKNLSNFENLIAQLPMNYKQSEPANDLRCTFISEGKLLRRRLECPQWIMRVQVVPVIFESKMNDLIQLD